jgi:hypothetical protein
MNWNTEKTPTRFQVWRKEGFERLSQARVFDTYEGRNVTGELLLAKGQEPLASVSKSRADDLCHAANVAHRAAKT